MDANEIRKTLQVFKTDNGLLEVRIFSTINKTEIYSGIFDNEEDLIREVNKYDREPYNIYFIFNELKDALNGMPQLNKMMRGAKTVNDKDIKYRRWLMIDFDPIREGDVKEIASTQEEFENSKVAAREARKYLLSLGFKQPVVCFSGNGTHLNFKLDNIECNEQTDKVIGNVLKYLAMKFTDEKVDCDTKVSNRARLTKFYSSVSRKGGNTPTRPHRKSEIVVVPPEIQSTEFRILEYISALYEQSQVSETPTQTFATNSDAKKFDLDAFLLEHNIEVLKEIRTSDGGRKLVLKTCPFDASHGKDSAIFVSPQGALTFTCFHSSCSGNNWRSLRLKFDPHAYDKPQQEQRQFRQPYIPERKKYQIKDENPELGKKWLSLSDIKKVNLSETKTIKTGFKDLDKRILGLNLGEVTLLSGSNSSGKSSWLNCLILNVIDKGNKVALWSGELPPEKLKIWIHNAAAGKEHIISKKSGDFTIYETEPNVGLKIDEWLDGKFFLFNNEYSNKWQQILNDISELLKLGVNLFILDNLFSMDIDIFDGDKNNKQKELILQICNLAKTHKIHIILVAHPRKAMGFLRKSDISGTADLTNAVDNVFICHRVNNDFIKAGSEFLGATKIQEYSAYGNCIEICKNRMFGVVDQLVGMYYEIESRRFMNTVDENIIYGWQDEPNKVDNLNYHTDFEQPYYSIIKNNEDFLTQGNEAPF